MPRKSIKCRVGGCNYNREINGQQEALIALLLYLKMNFSMHRKVITVANKPKHKSSLKGFEIFRTKFPVENTMTTRKKL